MYILGISALHHDRAAVLLHDGALLAAAGENGGPPGGAASAFPRAAIVECLDHAGLTPADLDIVGFYDRPSVTLSALLRTAVVAAPGGYSAVRGGLRQWARRTHSVPVELNWMVQQGYHGRFVWMHHHEAYAASAFFASPFDEAAVMTIDGIGEWVSSAHGIGRGNRVEITHEVPLPHSLGLLYSALSDYCGFNIQAGEYKLMALARHGQPRYLDALERIVTVHADGSFQIDMSYFCERGGWTTTARKLHALLEVGPRTAAQPMHQFYKDVAASAQQLTEEIVCRSAATAARCTGLNRLVISGAAALSGAVGGRLLREGPFDSVWCHPAVGDSGGAMGVALFIRHHLLDEAREPRGRNDIPGRAAARPASDRARTRRDVQWSSLQDAVQAHIPARAGFLWRDRRTAGGWRRSRIELPAAPATGGTASDALRPGRGSEGAPS